MLGLSWGICFLYSFLRFCRIFIESLILVSEELSLFLGEEGLLSRVLGFVLDCYIYFFLGKKENYLWIDLEEMKDIIYYCVFDILL